MGAGTHDRCPGRRAPTADYVSVVELERDLTLIALRISEAISAHTPACSPAFALPRGKGRILLGVPGHRLPVRLTEDNIDRLVSSEPMAPSGVACLDLAWQHREILLAP